MSITILFEQPLEGLFLPANDQTQTFLLFKLSTVLLFILPLHNYFIFSKKCNSVLYFLHLLNFSWAKLHRIRYMKSLVSEYNKNAHFNLEHLSHSSHLPQQGISILKRVWNSFDSEVQLFKYQIWCIAHFIKNWIIG